MAGITYYLPPLLNNCIEVFRYNSGGNNTRVNKPGYTNHFVLKDRMPLPAMPSTGHTSKFSYLWPSPLRLRENIRTIKILLYLCRAKGYESLLQQLKETPPAYPPITLSSCFFFFSPPQLQIVYPVPVKSNFLAVH